MGQLPSKPNDNEYDVQEDVVFYLLRFTTPANIPGVLMIDDDSMSVSVQDKLLCLFKLLQFFAMGCCDCDAGLFDDCSSMPSKQSMLKFYQTHGGQSFYELQKNWRVMQKVHSLVSRCLNTLIQHVNKTGDYNFANIENLKIQDILLLIDIFCHTVCKAEAGALCDQLCQIKEFAVYCSRMTASLRGLPTTSDWHCL